MKRVKLYLDDTHEESSKKKIQSRLDEIGLEYEVCDIADLSSTSLSDTEEIALSDPNSNTELVGKDEIIEYLENNYQSESWRRKEKISDVVYHIADAVFEFL